MKKIYNHLLLLAVLFLAVSCNEEWKDEQYHQYVSLKAPIGDKGCTQIYVRYKENGKMNYQLPVIVSGTTLNAQDLDVRIALDKDTLDQFNIERFNTKTELFYQLLPSENYDFSETVCIPAGAGTGLLDINFDFNPSGTPLDMVEKWILPLTVVEGNDYQPNMRKHYRKALLRVMPFNDYSGSYSTTAMQTYFYNADTQATEGDPMVANSRTAFVVDENTVFFYVGLMDEDLDISERRKYKINVKFNDDNTLTLIPADSSIDFEVPEGFVAVYSTSVKDDDIRPYIEHHYTTLRLTYLFNDVTSAPVPIRYKVTGTMLLERVINTQIPDRDQAIEW